MQKSIMKMTEGLPENWTFPLRRKTATSILRGMVHGVVAPFTKCSTFKVANYRVSVPSRSLFARQLANYQAYEPTNSNWLISTLKGTGQGLFLDVGANFGWYTLLAAKLLPEATIVALEPGQENFLLLSKNIAENRLRNVTAINQGADASASVAQLYAHEHQNPGAHSIRKAIGDVPQENITLAPLDQILAQHPGRIHLLKIDVEGYEVEVLLGATETLRRTNCLLVEYSPDFLSECGHEPTQLLDVLESSGFTPHTLRGKSLEPVARGRLEQRDPSLSQGHRWQVDLVFLRV